MGFDDPTRRARMRPMVMDGARGWGSERLRQTGILRDAVGGGPAENLTRKPASV